MQLNALGLGQQRQGELARVKQTVGQHLHHKKWMMGGQENTFGTMRNG
jgi:hypothetical protein